jgi:hypothetical protein
MLWVALWSDHARRWDSWIPQKHPVAEGHAALVERNEAAVRDGDTMGVPGEVSEHCLRPGDGRLGIDKPVLLPQRREMPGAGLATTEVRDLAEEPQPARGVRAPAPAAESRACSAPSACPRLPPGQA